MKLFLFAVLFVSTSSLALALRAPESPASASMPSAPFVVAPATFTVDAAHSSVLFRTKHFGVSQFYGRFNAFEGEVVYDAESIAQSRIRIEIKADSIDSNSEGRDKHLRSPDFLSAKEFPVIAFESKSVRASGDELAVVGDLTLHGVTREVSAEVEVVGQGDTPQGFKAGFEARFTVDMRDFDLSFIKEHPGGIGPDVDLIVSLECVRR